MKPLAPKIVNATITHQLRIPQASADPGPARSQWLPSRLAKVLRSPDRSNEHHVQTTVRRMLKYSREWMYRPPGIETHARILQGYTARAVRRQKVPQRESVRKW